MGQSQTVAWAVPSGRRLGGVRLPERAQRRLRRRNGSTEAGTPLGESRQPLPGSRFQRATAAKGIGQAEPAAAPRQPRPSLTLAPSLQDRREEDMGPHGGTDAAWPDAGLRGMPPPVFPHARTEPLPTEAPAAPILAPLAQDCLPPGPGKTGDVAPALSLHAPAEPLRPAPLTEVVPGRHGPYAPAESPTSRQTRPARRALPAASRPRVGPSGPQTLAGRSGAGPRRPCRARPAPRGPPGSVPGVAARARRAGAPRGARHPLGPSPHRGPAHGPGSFDGMPRAERLRRGEERGACPPARARGRLAPQGAGVWG